MGAIVALAAPLPLHAASEPEATIVLLVSPGQRPVWSAVRVHLAEIGTEVVTRRLSTTEVPEPSQPGIPRWYEFARGTAEPGSVAVFWIESLEGRQWMLYLLEPRGDRLFARVIAVAGGSDQPLPAAVAETVALIVRSAVGSLLTRDPATANLPLDEVQLERPAEVVQPEIPAEPQTPATSVNEGESNWLAGVNLTPNMWGDSPQQTTLALGLRARLVTSLGLGLFGGYRLSAPIRERSDAGSVSVTRHPAFVGLSYDWLARPWWFGAELEVCLDYATVQARTARDDLHVAGARARLLGSLSLLAYARLDLYGQVQLYLGAGAELFVNPYRLVVQQGDLREPLLEPRRLQPRAVLGVDWDI